MCNIKHQIFHIRKRNITQILKCTCCIINVNTKISKDSIKKRCYQENPEILNYQEKKRYDKVENFLQQLKQQPYYICTICHRSLYQHCVRLFKHEKYDILTADLYNPVKSFDE